MRSGAPEAGRGRATDLPLDLVRCEIDLRADVAKHSRFVEKVKRRLKVVEGSGE